jgi:hypothetical protein
MTQNPNTTVAVIGIDMGKNSFHVVGHDARGAIVLRQKSSRGQVEARLANIPPCLIGIRRHTSQCYREVLQHLIHRVMQVREYQGGRGRNKQICVGTGTNSNSLSSMSSCAA